MKLNCYKCQKEIHIENISNIMRSEECPHCYASLRCCMMCSFYDKNSYNECREPSAERIVDKEKANFCDFFKLGNPGQANKIVDDALTAANALFKK